MSGLPTYDPTPVPIPQPAGATAADIVAAMGAVPSPSPGVSAGTVSADLVDGVVQSIQPGVPWPTLTVLLSGSTTPVAGVRYSAAYSPSVNDTVTCFQRGTDVVVIFALAGGSGAGGGPVPLGTLIALDYALSDQAWLLCIGGTFSAATYPALYAARGNNNALPDARGVTLMGAGVNGIVLGTRDTSGGSEAHVHGSGGGHTHTEGAHAHTGAAHTHTGAAHSHGHSHATSADFVYGGGGLNGAAGVDWTAHFISGTDTDATVVTPGAGGSTTPGASGSSAGSGTGSTDPGSTASYGSGTANIPPNLGVNVYMRAL